jgi:hypothetical protein
MDNGRMDYQTKLKRWASRKMEMSKMLKAGMSKADVARHFGVTPQRVGAMFAKRK